MHNKISEWIESLIERGWDIKSEIDNNGFWIYFYKYAKWFEIVVIIIIIPTAVIATIIKIVKSMSPIELSVVGAIILFTMTLLSRPKK